MAPISRTVQKPSAPAATPTLVVKKTNMESEDGGKPWPRKQDATEYLAKTNGAFVENVELNAKVEMPTITISK